VSLASRTYRSGLDVKHLGLGLEVFDLGLSSQVLGLDNRGLENNNCHCMYKDEHGQDR